MNHTRSEIFNVKIQVRDKSRGQVWKIAPNFSTHQLLRGPCKITLWSYFPNFSLKTMKPFSVYIIENILQCANNYKSMAGNGKNQSLGKSFIDLNYNY